MEEMPAWMECEDILSRVEAELMSEALELLRKEMDAGRIKVEGNVAASSELTAQAERDLFIMEKLLADEQNMRYRYENLVNAVEEGRETNPEIVSRTEEVKRFLLVVSQISITVKYAKVFSLWFPEAGKMMKGGSAKEILLETARQDSERPEAVSFILSNKEFRKSEVLDAREIEMLAEIYKRCTNGN